MLKRSVMIEAPANQVWPWIVESEKYVIWNPHIEYQILEKKKDGVGTKYHIAKKTRRGINEGDGIVTEWVENRKFAFEMAGGWVTGTYTLKPTDIGCEVSLEQKQKFKGLKGKIIWTLFSKSSVAKNMEKHLTRLKSAVENSKPI